MLRKPFILPLTFSAIIAMAMFAAGSIPQYAHYHDFADQRTLLGIPHYVDVVSNLLILLAGLAGFAYMPRARSVRALDRTRFSWGVLFASLIATAAGSAWYHLAPDNTRLLADRLPIALSCAALLAITARAHLGAPRCVNALLLAFGVGSVAWWGVSGDLRPYLLLQALVLLAIPVAQHVAGAPRGERLAFGGAILFYVVAKLCEAADQRIYDLLNIGGHACKHLAAGMATLLLALYFGRLAVHHDKQG